MLGHNWNGIYLDTCLMQELGQDISHNKLICPSLGVMCPGVLIDTENATNTTVARPDDKLKQILQSVNDWKNKRPGHIFLNHMLDLLRASHESKVISLTSDFHCDLKWFN